MNYQHFIPPRFPYDFNVLMTENIRQHILETVMNEHPLLPETQQKIIYLRGFCTPLDGCRYCDTQQRMMAIGGIDMLIGLELAECLDVVLGLQNIDVHNAQHLQYLAQKNARLEELLYNIVWPWYQQIVEAHYHQTYDEFIQLHLFGFVVPEE